MAPGGRGWDWRKAGLILGLIGGAAWLLAWPTGWHCGVGIVGATGPWVQALFEGPQVLNWGSFVVLGMPVGAFIAAWRTRQLRWQIPNLPSSMRIFAAGLLIGTSATLAGGCNIGHTYTGVPTLALSSLTATLFIFLGAWLGNYLRFIRPQRVKLTGLDKASSRTPERFNFVYYMVIWHSRLRRAAIAPGGPETPNGHACRDKT